MMPDVAVDRRGQALWLTINRPTARNALSLAVMADLTDALRAFQSDPALRVAVVTGAGELAFSAGADLKEMARLEADGADVPGLYLRATRALFSTLLQTDKPLVAALNGVALAGGCELALACDIRLAADHARLGLVEARRGLAAHFGTLRLSRLAPLGVALEMLLAGRPIDARRAYAVGLVQGVSPPAELPDAVDALVADILACAPLSQRRMKQMVAGAEGLPLETALALDLGPDVLHSADRREGVRAFNEGRAPIWTGE